MKRMFLSGVMALALLPLAGVAADAFYINTGTVSNPQIDATNFVNEGLFQASGTYPYETFSTRNYTNAPGTYSDSGTMDGTPGFRFMTTSPTTGNRTMASSFFNANGGVIQANDPDAYYFYVCTPAVVGPSYLLISATNIVVQAGTAGSPKASLIVGANGELELTGKNIDLSTSGLEVLPVWGEARGSGNGDTNFIPDVAISDLYWGRTNFTDVYRLFSAGLWNGVNAQAPAVVYPRVLPRGAAGFSLVNPVADSYTNVPPGGIMEVTLTNNSGAPVKMNLATNIAKGALFVSAPANIGVDVGFSAGDNTFDTGLETAGVLLSLQPANLVTTQLEPAYIFIQDRLASGGTTGLLTSIIGCPAYASSRPANYMVSRGGFYPGAPGNYGIPPKDFFLVSGNTNKLILKDGVTNATVQAGELGAYAAYLDNVVSRPDPVAGGTVTNLSGRIRISADNLDLTGTRMRAEGQIIIKTSNLISSSNAVIDCENLSFNLASTNGTLQVQNLSKDTVNRLTGSIRVWSAVWSNSADVVLENYSYDTNNTPPATLAPVTNAVSIVFHAFMVDASALQTTLPVTVYDVTTHTTNVVISDNMSVGESMLIDGKSLTLDGNLTIPGVVPVVNPIIGYSPPGTPFRDWTYANVPNLLYFTNHGTFSIANTAHFGDDRATPYSTFVNTGTISAASIALKSGYLENRGALVSAGPFFMQCTTGKLEGGSSASGGNFQLLSGNLKLNDYQLAVNGGLYLRATNALFDAGGGAGNVFSVKNGFNLQIKPQTGDLLGTKIQTAAPSVPNTTINHTWAGADRGPLTAGYTNNTAFGILQVTSQSPSPSFKFAGTGDQNGFYVDLLDLGALGTNYQKWITIDPNLTIYYAAAKLGFTPPNTNGVSQQPEEYLDGQFAGHLRWVRDFAGPNSSMAVISNGVSIVANKALRNSKLIDSNNNGIPNYYDATPFSASGVTLTASLIQTNQPAATSVAISWTATPQTVYQVEFSSSPALNSWQPLLRYTNSATTNKIVSVSDTNAPGGVTRRFYRVGYTQ